MCETTFRLIAFVGSCVKRIEIVAVNFDSLQITLEALKSTYEVHSYAITAKSGMNVIGIHESPDFCDYVEKYD